MASLTTQNSGDVSGDVEESQATAALLEKTHLSVLAGDSAGPGRQPETWRF